MLRGQFRRWQAIGAPLCALAAFFVAGCGNTTRTVTVTSPAPAANGASTGEVAHVFEGTVTPNHEPQVKLDCSPNYLEAGDENRGSITDSIKINTAGSDKLVTYGTATATKSVAWGHIGSRLAQAVETFAAISGHHPNSFSQHYRFTLYCVSDQAAAWVIFG
jgi:hypothetical protein